MGDNILPSRTPLEAVKQEEVSFPHYFADFLLIIPEHIYVFACLYFDYSLSLTAYYSYSFIIYNAVLSCPISSL